MENTPIAQDVQARSAKRLGIVAFVFALPSLSFFLPGGEGGASILMLTDTVVGICALGAIVNSIRQFLLDKSAKNKSALTGLVLGIIATLIAAYPFLAYLFY